MNIKKPAVLALENGMIFKGYAFGADGESAGEVVFNTSMTGYQEILTDPSYHKQIVTMTYPLIGNYGVNFEDGESEKPHVAGFIVKEVSRHPSNFRMTETLDDYLKRYGIIGIENIDTRKLVRIIREKGAMRGILSTIDFDEKSLVEKAKSSMSMSGADLAREVSCVYPYYIAETPESEIVRNAERDTKAYHSVFTFFSGDDFKNVKKPLIAVLDYGVKYNILRKLVSRGFKAVVLPAWTTADEILATKPAGVLLSNGPGDPEAVTYAIETIKDLLGKVSIFGICLGHQLLGLALGGTTYKLKFGHRGANQPVMDTDTGKVEISSQNHGFAVTPGSIPQNALLTHMNLNDNTIEGLVCEKINAFSIQYHPESSPGPHDSDYLFNRFINNISKT